MGYFFFGAVLGFLFSSLFFIIALVAVGDVRKIQQAGPRRYVAEFILVAGLTAVTAVVLLVFTPSNEWVVRFRIPIPLVQVLLGVGTGVLLRVWLTRFLFLYHRDPEPRTLPAWADAAQRDAPARGAVGSVPATPEWIWPVGLISITGIAILLPYLEDMVARATSLKLGSIEVSIKGEQKAQNIALMAVDREHGLFESLDNITEDVDDLRKRLESDTRRYSGAQAKVATAANKEFLSLYQSTLRPALTCVSKLVARGTELEIIRAEARGIARPWLAIANEAPNNARIANHIDNLLKSTSKAMTGWSKLDPACTPPSDTVKPKIGAQVQDSFMFHWYLSYLLSFLDDRLSAIQMLERVGGRFKGEVNWSFRLGSLYYDEDPTLAKAIEHYESALRNAEAGLAEATRQIALTKQVCPTTRILAKDAPDLCYDWRRYKNAVGSLKNSVAYTHARSDRDSLSRARLLARESLKAYVEEMPANTASSDPSYWMRLDTYAYTNMMASARGANPDPKLIACAGRTFGTLVDHARKSLQDTLDRPDDARFRSNFVRGRFRFETYASHRVLAARILTLTRGAECEITDKEYKAMEKGDL